MGLILDFIARLFYGDDWTRHSRKGRRIRRRR